MDAAAFLNNYSSLLEPIEEEFFRRKEKEAAKISPVCLEMIRIYREFIKGGKRLRGALMTLGYQCASGKNQPEILKTSLAIEIQHSALLMLDDIMDRDDLRRGKPTIHRQYETIHQGRYPRGSASHFGLSMAINLGITGIFLALGILTDSDFKDRQKEAALKIWHKFLLETGFGQALDVTLENQEKIKETEVLKIHLLKTARYTVVGPMSVGATLANFNPKMGPAIEEFGQRLGIAFQLRDDELGLFGDEKALGKPVGADVREGKNTILRTKALESTKGKEYSFLEKAYGNQKITPAQIERVRKITIESGALAYSQNMMLRLAREAKGFIKQITSEPESQETLSTLVDFMVKRGK